MKLLGSLTSPFVRKIRVQLLEKEIPHQFVLEDVWSADSVIAKHNPLGKVPCLILDDGQAVFDSTVISGTLEYMFPTIPLLPTDPKKRALVRTAESLASGINDAAVAMLLERKFHEGDAVSQVWLDRQMKKIDQGVAWIADKVHSMPGGFVTEQFSLADVSAGSALFYLDFRMPQYDWRSQHPVLRDYAERLSSRPSFEATQPPK